MANKSKQDFLKKPDPSMTGLMLVVIDEYGTEALDWDPETIKMELEDDYHVELSSSTLDKICVGAQLLTTQKFYKSLPDFNNFCNILSDDDSSYGIWAPADAYDITGAMAEVLLLAPPKEPKEIAFDPEIIGYIVVALRNAHILTPPECLSFIPSKELAIKEIGSLSDDNDMFSAGYETGIENSQDLQDYEVKVLAKIMYELNELKLEHGDLEFLKKVTDGRIERNQDVSESWI